MPARRKAKPPESVDEALRRSLGHARNALAEALLAAHALLDAVSIAVTGRAASATAVGEADEANPASALASLADRIEDMARAVRGGDVELPDAWVRAVVEALDAEIARWEKKSQDDRDARAVLRAFLGLREMLWEFGLRGESTERTTSPAGADRDGDEDTPTRPASRDVGHASHRARRRPGGRQRARVQHIDVDG